MRIGIPENGPHITQSLSIQSHVVHLAFPLSPGCHHHFSHNFDVQTEREPFANVWCLCTFISLCFACQCIDLQMVIETKTRHPRLDFSSSSVVVLSRLESSTMHSVRTSDRLRNKANKMCRKQSGMNDYPFNITSEKSCPLSSVPIRLTIMIPPLRGSSWSLVIGHRVPTHRIAQHSTAQHSTAPRPRQRVSNSLTTTSSTRCYHFITCKSQQLPLDVFF